MNGNELISNTIQKKVKQKIFPHPFDSLVKITNFMCCLFTYGELLQMNTKRY